jgi:hypothetical protein
LHKPKGTFFGQSQAFNTIPSAVGIGDEDRVGAQPAVEPSAALGTPTPKSRLGGRELQTAFARNIIFLKGNLTTIKAR